MDPGDWERVTWRIDLLIIESDIGRLAIQVKRRSKPGSTESVSLIREFRGAMPAERSGSRDDRYYSRSFFQGGDASVPQPQHPVNRELTLRNGEGYSRSLAHFLVRTARTSNSCSHFAYPRMDSVPSLTGCWRSFVLWSTSQIRSGWDRKGGLVERGTGVEPV